MPGGREWEKDFQYISIFWIGLFILIWEKQFSCCSICQEVFSSSHKIMQLFFIAKNQLWLSFWQACHKLCSYHSSGPSSPEAYLTDFSPWDAGMEAGKPSRAGGGCCCKKGVTTNSQINPSVASQPQFYMASEDPKFSVTNNSVADAGLGKG